MVIPECPACFCNMFRLYGGIEAIVQITNPDGKWDAQEVWPDNIELPDPYCADCGHYINDEDMALVLQFIAVNQLFGREVGKLEKPNLARQWSKKPVIEEED